MLFLQSFELKLAMASVLGGGVLLADVAADVKGWEDVSLKVILIAALIFIGKLYLGQQAEHKGEMKDLMESHRTDSEKREERMNQAMDGQTKGMAELTALTREQTDYFKTVTRGIVDDRIKAKAS